MGIFFSKKKQSSRITEEDRAILQVKQTRDKIKQYRRKIEQTLEKEQSLVIELLKKGKKDRALLILRKKKYQEQVLARADDQLLNLQHMVDDLEFAQIEIHVINGLKFGNSALKHLHALLSIDEIEKVMDETRDGIEKQREIDEVLSSTFTSEDLTLVIDESEIEAEFYELMETEVDEEAPEVPEDVLPDVPTDLSEPDKRRKETTREPIAVTA